MTRPAGGRIFGKPPSAGREIPARAHRSRSGGARLPDAHGATCGARAAARCCAPGAATRGRWIGPPCAVMRGVPFTAGVRSRAAARSPCAISRCRPALWEGPAEESEAGVAPPSCGSGSRTPGTSRTSSAAASLSSDAWWPGPGGGSCGDGVPAEVTPRTVSSRTASEESVAPPTAPALPTGSSTMSPTPACAGSGARHSAANSVHATATLAPARSRAMATPNADPPAAPMQPALTTGVRAGALRPLTYGKQQILRCVTRLSQRSVCQSWQVWTNLARWAPGAARR